MSTGCQGAALMQLVAVGLADAVLTGMPTATYFRFQNKAYTNFAMEVHIQDFNAGVPNFGSTPKINIDRVGDLVYFMYILAELPGVGLPYPNDNNPQSILSNAVVAQPAEPFWTQDVGQALIEKTSVFIGGQCIDEIHSEFLYVWEELCGQPGKHLREMTGNYRSEASLMAVSRQPRNLYIPLPFWFTLNSGNALPLVSLQFHSFQVQVCIRHYQKLLKLTYFAMNTLGYSLSQIEKRSQYNPTAANIPQPLAGLSKLSSSDLLAKVIVCYVYLDQRERSQFADGQFETLINQHQYQETSVNQTVSVPNNFGSSDMWTTLELTFNHPVFEIYWVARLGISEDFLSADIPGFNEWFNFRGPLDTVTLLPIDPIKEAQLKLNNSNRFPQIECRYFRLVEPWQYHTNIVDHNMIYSYSFSLQPEDVQPAGSCNFSRIDNACLQFKVDRRCFTGPAVEGPPTVINPSANSHVSIIVMCQNYNILRFKYGLGGLRFAA
jgi:hypothetical protein